MKRAYGSLDYLSPGFIAHTFSVRFVPADWKPDCTVGGYAEVTDPTTIKRVRRQLRREHRDVVKIYGNTPKLYRDQPFWWTPTNTRLVVMEMLAPRGPK